MTRVIVGVVAIVLIGINAFAGFSGTNNTNGTSNESAQSAENISNEQADNEIFVNNFAFNPELLVIKKGTTITWTNMDTARHDVSFDDERIQSSELLAQGESYRRSMVGCV